LLKQKEKLSEKEKTRAKGKEDNFMNNISSTSIAQSSSMVKICINDSSP